MPLLVTYNYGTLQAYESSTKYEGALFFTEDTHQLFKGATEITKTTRVVSALPDTLDGEFGAIYVKMPEKVPYVFTGSDYEPIIKEYTTKLTEKATDATVPTSKAVISYVRSQNASQSGTVKEVQTLNTDDTELVFDNLLPNNVDRLYTGGSVSSILFNSTLETSGQVSEDYWVRIIFTKGSNVLSVRNLVINDDIKLMNPDFDVSACETIHLLFTYDGKNVCCICGGYA